MIAGLYLYTVGLTLELLGDLGAPSWGHQKGHLGNLGTPSQPDTKNKTHKHFLGTCFGTGIRRLFLYFLSSAFTSHSDVGNDAQWVPKMVREGML